jgi:D-xylose transport system permease protein
VGSVLGFISGLAAVMIALNNWNTFPTIVVLLLLGLGIGLAQGVIIAYLKVPAFIVTLGGLFIFRGALFGTTKGISIAPFTKSYQFIGQGYIGKTAGVVLVGATILLLIVMSLRRRRSRIKYKFEVETTRSLILRLVVYAVALVGVILILNSYKGIPLPVLIMIFIVLVLTFLTLKTPFGRKIYAIGGNITAARYAGVNIKRTIAIAFMINGLLAAIAGIVYSARINAGTTIAGQYMELDAIAAAIIGGASLTGGVGRVPGAILGALIMASIDNGMSLLETEFYWQYIVKGLVVVGAVWFDVYSKRKFAA